MNNYLPTDYQTFIAKSRYAKYIDGKGREDWGDTVERYMDNVVRPKAGNDSYVNQLRDAILNLEVMPSMRAIDIACLCVASSTIDILDCRRMISSELRSMSDIIIETVQTIAAA